MPPAPIVPPIEPQPGPPPSPRRKKWYVVGVMFFLAVVFIALNLFSNHSSGPQAEYSSSQYATTTSDETQYLIFNVGEYGDISVPKNASEMYAKAVNKDVDKKLTDFLDRLGTTGDAKHKLGFMVILPAWIWNSGSGDHGQIDAIIQQAFDQAQKRNMAVYFTIDSNYGGEPDAGNRHVPNIYNWWDPSLPGYNPDNKKNVEWTDWEGTPTKARYNLQGSGAKLPPVMCYNSSAILKESSYLVNTVIVPPVLKGIESLKAAGKEDLWAGMTIGLEPSLDDYTVIDNLDPAIGKHMDQDGALKTRLGYCALTNAGYSKSKPPVSFPDALAKINQEYQTYWARELVQAGISKDKLYTHVAAGVEGPLLQYTNAPLSIAFTDYSRPGWTTYASGPIAHNFDALYKLLADHGNPHWGATETSPTNLSGKPLNPEMFLSWHFNHGATVMVINTADTSAGGQVIAKSIWWPESIAAYKKFLSGQPLSEAAAISGKASAFQEFQAKVAKIQANLPAYLQAHPADQAKLTALADQLAKYQTAEDYESANQTADAILKIVGR
jgi:hypothetical protein